MRDDELNDDYSDILVSLKSNGPFSKRLLLDTAFANAGGTITFSFATEDEDEGYPIISAAFARALASHLIEQADCIESRATREAPTCTRCGGENKQLISPGRKFLFWGCRNCDAHARSMDSREPGKGAIPDHETELWTGSEQAKADRQELADKANVA